MSTTTLIKPEEIIPGMKTRIKGKIRKVARIRETKSQLDGNKMWIVYFVKGPPMTLFDAAINSPATPFYHLLEY